MSFNPRPPLLAGESCQSQTDDQIGRVSIHARHCWRANRQGGQCPRGPELFQSTPAIAGGRIDAHGLRPAIAVEFQSTPAIAGGRIHLPTLFRWTPELFQSTPAIAGGRILVVIPSAASSFLFQSTPAIAGGRIEVIPVDPDIIGVFQSTPAIAGGRIGPAICSRLGWRGFNPRPPLLAGESRSVGKNLCIFAVSIHARHCWRANHDFAGQISLPVYVSIHARHCWRANRRGGRCPRAPGWFQSTPAIAGGRIPSHVTPCQAMVFSCACANLAMPSCVCMKNHRQTIKNRIKTKCCEVREPPGEKLFTGGSRRSPYHGTGRAPPVTAPAGHQNPSP